jgi:hypothetical protein
MKEDDLVNAWIASKETPDREQTGFEEESASPEVHYNHYGKRGVVDLHLVNKLTTNHIHWDLVTNEQVVEVKSTSAVREATGANEIIRQFTRMCEYFYRDDSNVPQVAQSQVTFELTFLPTTPVIQHVVDNYTLYRQLSESDVYVPNSQYTETKTMVTFRYPDADNIHPILLDSCDTPDELRELAQQIHPDIGARIDEALSE